MVEYDEPRRLLDDPDGYLSTMVDALGPTSSLQLREKCRNSNSSGGSGSSGGTAAKAGGGEESLVPAVGVSPGASQP